VRKHFEAAMGADDFMQRLEMALYAFGFTGDNSIGGWAAQLGRRRAQEINAVPKCRCLAGVLASAFASG
jgi:hypothetical protein